MSPRALMTRCAGILLSGVAAMAQPTSRALRGSPNSCAIAPYVITRPRGTARTIAYTRRGKDSAPLGLLTFGCHALGAAKAQSPVGPLWGKELTGIFVP